MICALGWRRSRQGFTTRRAKPGGYTDWDGNDGAGMANIKADEISKILREQIENYEQTVSVGEGIARVHGLEKVMAGEMLAFPHEVFGIALNLEEEQVGVVLLGESQELQ